MKKYYQKDLKKIALKCAKKVETSERNKEYFSSPFKHIILDNFLPKDMAKHAMIAFPKTKSNQWNFTYDKDIEIKKRSNWESEFDIPEGIVEVIRILNSSIILNAMGERMKIKKLIPDPYFTGGGLNITERSGLLDVHIDGNYHDATSLNRRINLLIYLNPEWEKSWGGELGLYDSKGDNCLKKINPIFNRCVIFDSHDTSFHGLPSPINFPKNQLRKSIILYYYTFAPRPQHQVKVEEPHSALWKKRDLLDKKGKKKRKFS